VSLELLRGGSLLLGEVIFGQHHSGNHRAGTARGPGRARGNRPLVMQVERRGRLRYVTMTIE
jgi:hypothetical protein